MSRGPSIEQTTIDAMRKDAEGGDVAAEDRRETRRELANREAICGGRYPKKTRGAHEWIGSRRVLSPTFRCGYGCGVEWIGP